MIRFKRMENVVDFLEKNLPPKIKDELFFSVSHWEHKGVMRESRNRLTPHSITEKLREYELLIGIFDDTKNLFFPNEYILQWTKLKKIIERDDSISTGIEKYSLISINTACKMLDVTRPTVYKLLNDKQIPVVEILSQKRIQLKDLLDYIESQKHT